MWMGPSTKAEQMANLRGLTFGLALGIGLGSSTRQLLPGLWGLIPFGLAFLLIFASVFFWHAYSVAKSKEQATKG